MKKLITFLMAFCMLFLMMGCSANNSKKESGHHEEHSIQMWNAANCQQPKTCAVCGYTEGELGDHSVKVGTCHHCNEFQNKELFDKIKTDLTDLTTDLKVAYDFLQEKSSDSSSNELVYAVAIETVSPTFDKEKAKLEKVLEACGEYEELADIKRQVETSLKYYPVKSAGTTLQESKEYITNARMCYTYMLEALNYTQFVS